MFAASFFLISPHDEALALGYVIPAIRAYSRLPPVRQCSCRAYYYNVLPLDKEGRKDMLGMYVSHSKAANFWLNMLTDLQNRGVRDVLIACVDGHTGFPDAINSVFPNTDEQLCIVHRYATP